MMPPSTEPKETDHDHRTPSPAPTRGLGRNVALSIAQRGGDVIVTYRSNKAEADAAVFEATTFGRKAVALKLDVSDFKSFPAFAETLRATLREVWGRDSFDHLVHNAGHGEMAPFAETTEGCSSTACSPCA